MGFLTDHLDSFKEKDAHEDNSRKDYSGFDFRVLSETIINTAKTIHSTYSQAVKENNIKNTFRGRFPDGITFLINCSNRFQPMHGIYWFEVYDHEKNIICTAETKKGFLNSTVSLIDSDGTILLQMSANGLSSKLQYVDEHLATKDPRLAQKLKLTFAIEEVPFSKDLAYKKNDDIFAYALFREDYTGGQVLLDLEDTTYLIPLLVYEILRQTRSFLN